MVTAREYTILGRLGRGALHDHFLVRVTSEAGTERYLVLQRVMYAETDKHYVHMRFDEARLISMHQHPNIVEVYDIGMLARSYFFTTEFVHGLDAAQVLVKLAKAGQRLPIEHALYIAANVALALHDAHERTSKDGKPLGILHRDVTPWNVMLAYDGRVKLTDFGVAKAAEDMSRARGDLGGKRAYLSPEQCKGRALDRRSDIFLLGIVLHELLTGRKLFRGGSDFEILTMITKAEVAKPSAQNPDVGPELDALVLKALAKDRGDRFPTAAAMHEAIEEVARQRGYPLSAASLGGFMRELFGIVPEPWLALAPGAPAVTFSSDLSALDAAANERIEVFLRDAPELGATE